MFIQFLIVVLVVISIVIGLLSLQKTQRDKMPYFQRTQTDKTPCEIKFQHCTNEVNKILQAGEEMPADSMPCEECDSNGLYINNQWSHPLIQKTYCFDKYSGKHIPGTDQLKNAEDKIDCNKFPPNTA